MSRKKQATSQMSDLTAVASLPSAPEAAVAQRLLDRRAKRMKPPKMKFERKKETLEISFEGDDQKAAWLAMNSVTGLHNAAAVDLLLGQLSHLSGADLAKANPHLTNNAIALLDELEPSDGAEAMLTAQMVAVHITAMECYARAALPNQSLAARELNLKHAGKLSRIYSEQVAALDKHRRKGQQTVVVEHVHVHEGGQAIVGTVTHRDEQSVTSRNL